MVDGLLRRRSEKRRSELHSGMNGLEDVLCLIERENCFDEVVDCRMARNFAGSRNGRQSHETIKAVSTPGVIKQLFLMPYYGLRAWLDPKFLADLRHLLHHVVLQSMLVTGANLDVFDSIMSSF